MILFEHKKIVGEKETWEGGRGAGREGESKAGRERGQDSARGTENDYVCVSSIP